MLDRGWLRLEHGADQYAMYEWPLCPASRHDGAYVWSDTRRISSDPERRLEMLRYGVLLGNRERWDYDSVAALMSDLDVIESGRCGECGWIRHG
jgi:hypothetical protein